MVVLDDGEDGGVDWNGRGGGLVIWMSGVSQLKSSKHFRASDKPDMVAFMRLVRSCPR